VATDLYGSAVATVGNSVYSAGGFSFSEASLALFERYDAGSNTWTTLAPLATPSSLATLAYDPRGNRLFYFGGVNEASDVLADVEVYDIAGNTWSAGPALPETRWEMAGGTVGNLIYLVGGFNTVGGSTHNQNWQFDPSTGIYTAKAIVPTALAESGSAVSGGRLYILGGRDDGHLEIASNFAYNPGSNSWTTLASLPTAVSVAGATALSGAAGCADAILVAGGGDLLLTTDITQIYDIASDTWAAGPPLPTARSYLRAAQVNDTLLVIGGYDGTTSVTTVDRIQGPPLPVGLIGFSVE
jgi:N-acetylneuraminic acid mutarotase